MALEKPFESSIMLVVSLTCSSNGLEVVTLGFKKWPNLLTLWLVGKKEVSGKGKKDGEDCSFQMKSFSAKGEHTRRQKRF